MMKNEFLARLKELLADLPQEEREEAVRYYEDYFADAGPLEEARVLKELVSPEDVAEKIRAGCVGGMRNDGVEMMGENVFENRADAVGQDGEPEPRNPWTQSGNGAQGSPSGQDREPEPGSPWTQSGNGAQDSQWEQPNPGFTDARSQDEWMRMDETYAQDYEERHGRARSRTQGYAGDGQPRGATMRTKSYFSPVIFVLALLFGLPIICPILIAFICVMGAFFLGFGFGGVVLVAGGVALVGGALANASAGMGLLCLFSGGGLILTAIGILFIVFAVNCAFRAVPALFRGIRRVVSALRGRLA